MLESLGRDLETNFGKTVGNKLNFLHHPDDVEILRATTQADRRRASATGKTPSLDGGCCCDGDSFGWSGDLAP